MGESLAQGGEWVVREVATSQTPETTHHLQERPVALLVNKEQGLLMSEPDGV